MNPSARFKYVYVQYTIITETQTHNVRMLFSSHPLSKPVVGPCTNFPPYIACVCLFFFSLIYDIYIYVYIRRVKFSFGRRYIFLPATSTLFIYK